MSLLGPVALVVCLTYSLLGSRSVYALRSPSSAYRLSLTGSVAGSASRADFPARGWQRFIYGGATVPAGPGQRSRVIAGYSLGYPSGWSSRLWPDSLATYGQLDLRSPTGGAISVLLLPLRPRGPMLSALMTHDRAVLSHVRQDRVSASLGAMVRLSGWHRPVAAGLLTEILYLERDHVVYRLFSTRPARASGSDLLERVAATLRLTTRPGPSSPSHPPASQPGEETCCHCPAWGTGWGVPLTSLNGVTAYGNGGTTDNGCSGTYGILYQCVELAQRYFAQRWGYPPIWPDVEAAADMRAHHPEDVMFIPNGGAPEPQAGDLLLFNGGTYGHVAVVKSVDRRAGRITVIEENWSSAGEARLPLDADGTVGLRDSVTTTYTVAGWLHSPRNVPAATPVQ